MTEDEIFEILRKQEELIRKKPTFYVHYDPVSQKIVNLRNYFEETDTHPFVTITSEEFDFSSPDFNIANYRVLVKSKKLEKIVDEDAKISTIDDLIYEIPKIVSKTRITYADRPFDLLIEQNNPLGEFRIKLSKDLKEKLSIQGVGNQTMSIYVTAPNDPNILYKTLNFKLNDIIRNEFYTMKFDIKNHKTVDEFNGTSANIYALKYFENYLHVDIRDD
jgi:hypothetical protein